MLQTLNFGLIYNDRLFYAVISSHHPRVQGHKGIMTKSCRKFEPYYFWPGGPVTTITTGDKPVVISVEASKAPDGAQQAVIQQHKGVSIKSCH